MFRIRDSLVQIRIWIWIRIRGSVPLTNGISHLSLEPEFSRYRTIGPLFTERRYLTGSDIFFILAVVQYDRMKKASPASALRHQGQSNIAIRGSRTSLA